MVGQPTFVFCFCVGLENWRKVFWLGYWDYLLRGNDQWFFVLCELDEDLRLEELDWGSWRS